MSKSRRAQPRELTPLVDWAGVHTNRVDFDSAAIIFGPGDPAEHHVRRDWDVRLSVLSHTGKKAVIAVLNAGHFFGEGCLAEMVGTTRSRVNFFMNKFRKLGFIDYNGALRINNSLLSVLLRD
jgi:CRP-like cAMP-binding protein